MTLWRPSAVLDTHLSFLCQVLSVSSTLSLVVNSPRAGHGPGRLPRTEGHGGAYSPVQLPPQPGLLAGPRKVSARAVRLLYTVNLLDPSLVRTFQDVGCPERNLLLL